MPTTLAALLLMLPSSLASPTKVSNLYPRQSACPAHNTAIGTFFCSGTDPNQVTACGNTFDPNAPGVAISTALIPDSEALAPYCGMTVILDNTDAGIMGSAPIIDLCATCDEGSDQLDLSPATFQSLGGDPDCTNGGQLDISWFLEDSNGVNCI